MASEWAGADAALAELSNVAERMALRESGSGVGQGSISELESEGGDDPAVYGGFGGGPKPGVESM